MEKLSALLDWLEPFLFLGWAVLVFGLIAGATLLAVIENLKR